jgi:hypothetical protein
MAKTMRLKEIGQKAFRASAEDGLMEIAIGVCLMAMSARLVSRVLIFTLAFPLFLPRLLVLTLRKRITYRRIGYVRLIPDEAKDVVPGIFLMLLVLVAIMAFAFFLFGDMRDFNLWEKWCAALFGVQLAGFFVMLGSKSGCARFHVFALWSVMSGFVFSILPFEFRTAGLFLFLLTVGSLLTLWGLALLIRFVRKYPKPAKEVSNGAIS